MFSRGGAGSRLRRMRLGLIFFLAVALTGSASLPLSMAANGGLLGGSGVAWLDLAARFAPSPGLMRLLDGSDAINYGSDGRLTFLLLGSDFRTHRPGNGERTDMIMVLTVNRNTGRMAAASFPRDLAEIPLPNGTIHKGRINELLKKYTIQKGSRAAGAEEVRKVMSYVIGVHIDYVAVLRFKGFDTMMDELGSIRLPVVRQAKDPKLWDADPSGVYFPKTTNYELYGTGTKCRGHWRFGPNTGQSGYECHRAIMYARTRKGKGNSDFKRQMRGVDIVLAAITKAKASNYGSSKVSSFVSKAGAQGVEFYSSLPMTVANATELYGVLKKAQLGTINRVVFKPKAYATHISGTSKYRIKTAAVRNWINAYFKNI